MKKKKFKIGICNGLILSYNSIEKTFKEKLLCNIFDCNIYTHISINSFELTFDCKINKYSSIELLMNNLNYYFTDYSIKKEKEKDVLILNAILKTQNPFLDSIFECNNLHSKKDYFIYIKDRLFYKKDFEEIISNIIKDKLNILSIDISNNDFFVFTYNKHGNKIETIELRYENFVTS